MPCECIANWYSNIFVLNRIKNIILSAVLCVLKFVSCILLKSFNISLLRELLRRIMEENGDSETEVHTDSDDGLFEEQVLVTEAGDAGPDTHERSDDEEEQFDITLPDAHSYMGPSLEALAGRRVLEAGWSGRVAGAAHHGAVFPGETVPMLLPRGPLADTILADRLFCLLAPDESGTRVSGLGVVCEVQARGAGGGVLARAAHRVRLRSRAPRAPLHAYSDMQMLEVEVLPELCPGAPLRPARLAALDPLRRAAHDTQLQRRLRRLDAAGSAWPAFVWRMLDYRSLRARLADHFRELDLGNARPPHTPHTRARVARGLYPCRVRRGQDARGAGVAVVLGGGQPGAVGARPARAVRRRRRAAAPASGAALPAQVGGAVLRRVRRRAGAPRPRVRHERRRRARQLHQPRRLRARRADGARGARRGAGRAERRVLVVPRLPLARRQLRRLRRARGLEVRRDAARAAADAVLRAVPQRGGAARVAAARRAVSRAPPPDPGLRTHPILIHIVLARALVFQQRDNFVAIMQQVYSS